MKIKQTLACAIVIGLSGATVRGADSEGYFPKYHSSKSSENTSPQTKTAPKTQTPVSSKVDQQKKTKVSYFSIRGGPFLHDVEGLDTGIALGVAFGTKYLRDSYYYKAEMETTFRHNATSDGYVYANQTAIMANLGLGVITDSAVSPYFIGGIGGAYVVLNTAYYSLTDFVLAFQLGGGLDFELSEQFSLDIGYRLYFTDRPDFLLVDNFGHTFLIGLSYYY